MMRQQRRELLRNSAIGVLLTVLAVGLQAGGALGRLENWFYDQRCRYFQPSTPPTNLLEHVDVDDDSIAAIGRWPWPRDVLAQIIDELHNAGAQAIGLDILLADPDQSVAGEPDRVLAKTLGKSQNIVLPVSVTFGEPGISPRQEELVGILKEDLETPQATVNTLLATRKLPPATSDEFVTALHQAAESKIKDAGFPLVPAQQVKRLLLPRQDQFIVNTLGSRVLDEELTRAQALKSIQRFGRPIEPGIVSPVLCRDEITPLKQFSDVAAGCGFVDFIPSSDGVSRRVPLFVQDNDRLFPQFGLALACTFLKIRPDQVRIEPGRVIVPRPNGELSIPVVTQRTSDQPKASLFIDVPFFGSSDWRTSYDYPRHQNASQHINVTDAWAIIRTRKQIRGNDLELDDAIGSLMADASPEKVKPYLANRPDPADFEARERTATSLLAQAYIRSNIEAFDKESAEEQQRRDIRSQRFVAAAGAALRLPAENQQLAKQLRKRSESLRREVGGKAVLIGSAATAAHDFRTTPLHVQCPGSIVHGVIFNAIMTGQVWRRLPDWVNLGATVMVGLLVTVAIILLPPWLGFVAAVVVAAAYLGLNCEVLFGRMQLIADMSGPVAAVAGVWAGLTLLRLVAVSAERTQIVRRFRYYVDPALVDYVVENPNRIRLEGEVRDLTVVVTDLDGFGAIADQLRERTVELLNDYMNLMVPLIRARGGYVNKFLGGGIMFFFGAPVACDEHAARAVEAVVEMQTATTTFNDRRTRRGMPPVRMRAGISSGPMVVGDAGADIGSDYTVLGAPVGLCFQFERANKLFGTRILIGEPTLKQIAGRYLVRPIGKIVVPTERRPVFVYEPICLVEKASDRERRLAQLTAEVVGRFNSGNNDECLRAIARLEEEFGQNPLAAIYLRLCGGKLTQLSPEASVRLTLAT